MRYQRLGDAWILRLETDDEIFTTITRFAGERAIDTATVSGIGAVHHVVLGYFDRVTRDYVRHSIEDDVEIVSLAGNIALKDGKPFPHLHVIVSGRDFQAKAGHLFEGKVGATCEVVIKPLAGTVRRTKDERTGLFLLDVGGVQTLDTTDKR